MKKIILTFIVTFLMTSISFSQAIEDGINSRISPPLVPHNITQQLAALEVELIEANKEVDFWRNARFYNDKKRERERKEKLVFWAQKTVEIRNKMTKLKQDRSFYMHQHYKNQRYFYQKNPKPPKPAATN